MSRRDAADDDAAETRESAAAAVQGTNSNGLPTTSTQENIHPKIIPTDDNNSSEGRDGVRKKWWILPLFITNMSLLILFYMVMMVYGGGVVRTLERRFGLRSAQTGLMQSANDVLHVCIVIFIGYFGRTGHKPRLISVTVLSSALAGFMMASPHFLLSSSYDHPERSRLVNNATGGIVETTSNRFCLNWNASGKAISGDQCEAEQGSSETESAPVHPAYYVFLTAQFISGIGGSGLHTLSLAYIDENAPGSKSSFYIGIVTSMYAFGPLGGMLLAAMTLRLPENLLSPDKSGPSDPSFIGCWWLGYVICGSGLLATAIPLWFFPKSCSEKATVARRKLQIESAERSKSTDENALSVARREIKEFPRRLLHLLRNKAYIVNLISVVCGGFIVIGVFSNLVRYIEIHFLERAFVGSLIGGLVGALSGAIGSFLGGFVMSRLKIRPRGAIKIVLFSEVVFTIGIVILLLLKCPQLHMAGQIDAEENRFTIITDCNKHCACPTSRQSYAPVCGSDNLTYFSACTAGCRSFVNGTYSECGCIGSGNGGSYGGIVSSGGGGASEGPGRGWALPGLCRPPCSLLIPFAVTLFLMGFLGSVARVPSTIVNLRIVDEDERAFALSVNSFAINLLAFIPAPLLYGSLVDSACILWQTTCKKTGSCLLFDTDRFRHVTYGTALAFQCTDLVMTFILFLLIRKMIFRVEETERKVNQPDDEEKRPKESREAIELKN